MIVDYYNSNKDMIPNIVLHKWLTFSYMFLTVKLKFVASNIYHRGGPSN